MSQQDEAAMVRVLSADLAAARAEVERLQDYADSLCGERFSDRVHVALKSRTETAEAEIAALHSAREQQIETAFKAGYCCQWVQGACIYIFDPAMKPGDPDGAFNAWKASHDR